MKVLAIDDNPDHRELIIGKVRKAFPGTEFTEASRRVEFEHALSGQQIDLVLTDYRLNWTDGLTILREVRKKLPRTPVVMVTDTGSEEIATEGMKAGLSDYVLKSHMHRLPLAIQESLEKARLRSEHEAALERMKGSEERYRAVSELCSDYAYALRVEQDGTLEREWITQAFTRITGYNAEDIKGGLLLPLAHPDDRHLIEESRERLQAGQACETEVRIITKSGAQLWLRDYARPVWDLKEGRTVRIYGAGQDITQRKRAEEERTQRAEAEASERRYRILAEAIPQIVWTARGDGWIDYWNQRWYDYTGLAFDQSKGWGWMTCLHPDDSERTYEVWKHSVETGATFEIESRLRRGSDGAYRWHLGRALPLRSSDGRIVSWFGTCTDIEDRKQSEENLRQAQKLESIGLLAGGIAHDFNNLLTGILGNTSLAQDEIGKRHPARPLLDDVVKASERAADLTHQLLAYSGKGRFFVQPLNISELVREISMLVRSSIPKKVDLRLDLEEDLPQVEADSTQIQQLIMNLVINGAEAIGDDRGGTVVVSTGLQEVDAGFLQANHFAVNGIREGQFVKIKVHDTGCGMDESTMQQIFDPFFTTKFTGRGLGMAAALGIVRGHKGAILLQSEVGKGSTFQVLLPVAAGGEPGTDRWSSAPDQLQGEGTVLVVDDENVVRQAAANFLEKYGYRVVLAENGREGVEVFRELSGEITLVLLDMTMPYMSGEETLECLRQIRHDVTVVASSGYNEATADERFRGKGLAGFIQKPYIAAKLAEKVKEALEARKSVRRAGGSEDS